MDTKMSKLVKMVQTDKPQQDGDGKGSASKRSKKKGFQNQRVGDYCRGVKKYRVKGKGQGGPGGSDCRVNREEPSLTGTVTPTRLKVGEEVRKADEVAGNYRPAVEGTN